jgi:ketosteroid isomerase-like protein
MNNLDDQTAQTLAVLKSHAKAFRGGVERILEDYSDDAVIMSPSGIHKGHHQIRLFFENEIVNFPEGFWQSLNTLKLQADGEYAYFLWEAKPWHPLGCDSFVVRDGKIVFQSSTI